ncbi:tetratricopeptide repeat protein [Sphingomonas lutea]|uniref:Tetratricopeptide repeat protein n=1 Tax=Sphingomonas lutea TaxID=1045317 RepID=A0A7G9SFR9_9SPHN|nr:tetratricopeptide repeat protein [Sphingomonas lutea]QNN66694.1 tetratricopeptide repeat protein [Sphingomonas lutea]
MTAVALAILLALASAALAILGVRGRLLLICFGAMLVAAVGFVAATPTFADGNTAAARSVVPLTQARHAFYGSFGPGERWLIFAEGRARAGNTEDAVGLLQNAVRRYPGDPQLWVGLGNALVDHARGMTPPAQFAFDRAAQLSPGYPAPDFFRALALARYGDRAEAARIWRALLASAPADAGWRPMVVQGLALIGEPAPSR